MRAKSIHRMRPLLCYPFAAAAGQRLPLNLQLLPAKNGAHNTTQKIALSGTHSPPHSIISRARDGLCHPHVCNQRLFSVIVLFFMSPAFYITPSLQYSLEPHHFTPLHSLPILLHYTHFRWGKCSLQLVYLSPFLLFFSASPPSLSPLPQRAVHRPPKSDRATASSPPKNPPTAVSSATSKSNRRTMSTAQTSRTCSSSSSKPKNIYSFIFF